MACAILAALAIFQVLLAAGAPLGRYAWGGQHDGVLPTRLRIASLSSLVIYVLMALVLLLRANLITSGPSDGTVRVAVWVVTGYLVVGVVMNAMSRSSAERQAMTPTAAALAALSLVVALTA